jgi:hypothetical protein
MGASLAAPLKGDYCIFKENIFTTSRFLCRCFIDILQPPNRSFRDRKTHAELRNFTMKRILSALITSVALFAAVSGTANAAAAPAKCDGPASYCNVFFGQ